MPLEDLYREIILDHYARRVTGASSSRPAVRSRVQPALRRRDVVTIDVETAPRRHQDRGTGCSITIVGLVMSAAVKASRSPRCAS